MINAAVFICEPLRYKQFNIYPPTVREVVTNPKFNQYLRIMTFSQEEIEDEFVEKEIDIKKMPTPFEFLLANCYQNEEVSKLTKEAFNFFMHIKVEFLYDLKAVLVGSFEDLKNVQKIEDLVLIKEEDFFEIQNLIRRASGDEEVEKPNPNEDPRIKQMKAKARRRDRLKAKQQNGGIPLSTCLVAICCMGIGITPLTIGEMSYASINAIISMYQEKEKYQLDTDSLLAGAVDSKKVKPVYWIKNPEE